VPRSERPGGRNRRVPAGRRPPVTVEGSHEFGNSLLRDSSVIGPPRTAAAAQLPRAVATPERPAPHLRNLTPPKVGAPKAAITAYQEQVALRAPYALHAVGGRNDDGSWDFGCRAMSLLGALRCDLKPDSMAKLPTPRRPTTDPTVFTPRRLPKVCGQQKSRVQMDELPFWQPLPHGSVAWYDSFNRRNRIEGIFGNVKNDASQNVTRGRFRVMGMARVSLMTLFIVMAANLRLAQTFRARQEKVAADAAREVAGHVRQRRQPRMHTRLRAEMGAASPRTRNSPPSATPAPPDHPVRSRPLPASHHLTALPQHHLATWPARKRAPGRAACPRSTPKRCDRRHRRPLRRLDLRERPRRTHYWVRRGLSGR
jgi:hypothetical protein